MNFISVMAITREIAREQAIAQTGYAPETIGQMKFAVAQGNNSRQKAYVFETTNDVSSHPLYAKARLSDRYDLTIRNAEDGPVLSFGPEVTVGG